MRRPALIAACIALFSLSGAAAALAQSAMAVPVDQSRRVPFSGMAASVITGNSDLAYAYVVSPTDVRVVGRKTGVTNLVVLDGAGRTLFEREIAVGAGGVSGSTVTIYRGGDATNYSCTPNCNQQGNGGGAVGPGPSASAAPQASANPLAAVGQAVQGFRDAGAALQ